MKQSILAVVVLLASGLAVAGVVPNPGDGNGRALGTEMGALAALGLVSLVVGAQAIARRRKK